jgi:Leucine-rich repeat (LRR) protein
MHIYIIAAKKKLRKQQTYHIFQFSHFEFQVKMMTKASILFLIVKLVQCCINEDQTCECNNRSTKIMILNCITVNKFQSFLPHFTQLTIFSRTIQTLTYANKNISIFPESHFTGLTIQTLNLFKNEIEEIQEKSFSGINMVTHVYLNENLIRKINAGSFSELHTLIHIDLSSNQLSKIEPFQFKNLTRLEFLSLNENRIEIILTDSFKGLFSLRTLFLNKNQLKLVAMDFFSDLRVLNLVKFDENQIQFLNNETFGPINLRSVTKIILEKNFINSIGAYSFSSFQSVTGTLNLDKQNIHILYPFAFHGLRRIVSLFLRSNYLKRLENFTFQGLESLNHLNLDGNFITSIELDCFQGISRLFSLSLDSNNLKNIDGMIFRNLSTLKNLLLSKNSLLRINSRNFVHLISLNCLVLSENKIKTIEVNAFDQLGLTLQLLSLSLNDLQTIRSYYFQNMIMLKELILSFNQISSIEYDSFFSTTELIILDLSHNFIFSLDARVFMRLKKLETLKLEFNSLTFLSKKIFEGLGNLRTLLLTSNMLIEFNLPPLGRIMTIHLESNLLKSHDFSQCKSLNNLYLAKNRISFLKYPQQLVNLELSDNQYLRDIMLYLNSNTNVTFLKFLDLSNNKNIFSLCENLSLFSAVLETLKLKNTTEKLIKSIDFLVLSSLQNLDLSYNDLSHETGNLILIQVSQLKNLRVLNLIRTFIFNFILPSQMPISLQKIYLSENLNFRIQNKTDLLAYNSVNLLELGLSGLEISEIEFGLRLFTKLELLDLSRNKLSVLRRSDFETIRPIKWLNLSMNMLKLIESGSINSTFFFFIDLSYNELKDLSDDIFVHKDIRIGLLNISFNPLMETYSNTKMFFYTFISSANSLTKMPKIKSTILHLDRNRIVTVNKESFLEIDKPRDLFLSSNKICVVHGDAFSNSKSLINLDLSQNILTNLSNELFKNLVFMEYLNLSSNLLEQLHVDLFKDLFNLRTLDLSFNRLKFIDENTFINLNLLKKLSLNDNMDLNFIDVSSLHGLSSIKEIFISQESLLNKQNNVIVMREGLRLKFVKIVNRRPYFTSINLIFVSQNIKEEIIECSLVFYFLQKYILTNIYNDQTVLDFFLKCQTDFNTLVLNGFY